jgi:hypothetical protein
MSRGHTRAVKIRACRRMYRMSIAVPVGTKVLAVLEGWRLWPHVMRERGQYNTASFARLTTYCFSSSSYSVFILVTCESFFFSKTF